MKLSRRDFIHAGCAVAAASLVPNPVEALLHGSAVAAPTGRSLLNIASAPVFPFKNLLKMAGANTQIGLTNSDGYPVTGFTAAGLGFNFPSTYAGQYTFTYAGSQRLDFQFPAQVFDGGAAVPALSGANSGYVNNIVVDGTLAKPVVFDWSIQVSNVANNGSGAIRVTITPGGLVNVQGTINSCTITGVVGVPGANGTFNWTFIDDTHADLVGSTFSGSYISGGSFNFMPRGTNAAFRPAGTFSGLGGMILCRSSAPYAGDLAAIQGGVLVNQFNDDFLNAVAAINPSTLRFLDASGIVNSFVTRTKYVPPISAMSYVANTFALTALVGTISGTNAFTCGSYTDMPVSWTDGEMFQGTLPATIVPLSVTSASAGASNGLGGNLIRLTVSSTTGMPAKVSFNDNSGNNSGTWAVNVINGTQIDLASTLGGKVSTFSTTLTGSLNTATMNVNSRGAKVLTNQWGDTFQTFGGSPPTSGTDCNFVYDSFQDVVLVQPQSGQNGMWPLELRVALCNKLRKNYWHQFPHMYDLPSVGTEAAYISANLSSGLSGYFEYSNEVWNSGFQEFHWCTNRAKCFGFTGGWESYDALYHRLFMGQVTTSWAPRTAAQLHRVLPSQFVAGASNDDQNFLYRGTDLNGTSFPLYAAAGYANYDSAPNRPIDFTEDLSYAPYYDGAILAAGGLFDPGVIPIQTAADVAGMTNAADLYATGTAPNIAAALAWCDNDVRQGTTRTQAITSASGSTFTLNSHGYSNNQAGVFTTSGALYTGLSLSTIYYVVGVTTNTFQVSLTQGGSAISISGGSGTQSFGILGRDTLLIATLAYSGFASAATTFSKGIICYEGAYQVTTLTQAQCTTYSISTSYGATSVNGSVFFSGGTVWNMLIGYKNSDMFKQTVLKQFADQKAVFAATVPGWYRMGDNFGSLSNDPWSIYGVDLYSPTPFKSFDALQQFNA